MKEIKNQNKEILFTKTQELILREELNLAKLPIFLPSHSKLKSLKIQRKSDNEKQTVIVGIFKDLEMGVFSIFDYKVYLFLIWKHKQVKEINQQIDFTFNEIIQFLNLSMSGKSRKIVKGSLEKLANIPVYFSHFVYKNKNEYVKKEDHIHILSYLSFVNFKDAREKREKHRCKFHDYVVNNLDFNHTKPTLFHQVNSFKNDYSIILYRYLDIIFASSNYNILRKTWKQIAAEIYMQYTTNSEIKRYLIPALEELKGKELSTGFISDFKEENTEVLIFKTTKKQIIENEIDSEGFQIKLVKKLEEQYGQDVVNQTKTRILAKKNTIKNVNAFLVKSIENGWNLSETAEEQTFQRIKEQQAIRKVQEQKRKEQEKIIKKQQEDEEKYENIFSAFSDLQKNLIKQEAIRRIEKQSNQQYQPNDKLVFSEFSILNEIIEILREAENKK
jgi:hypothetical protein